ncbi:hypothetical protein BGZ59_007789 [Podila verticillata]|nr:hypothetical protein BGZ59_007789 [Podila verticillata]
MYLLRSKESVRLPAERSVISLGYNVDTPIPQGSYYVVWCISLSSMDPTLLKLIRATSRVFRPNGSDEYNDEIDSDEAAFLQQASRDSSSGALRLRIPSRISIPESLESADLSLFIELEDSLLMDEMLNVCFVDVHYVDLVSANVDGTNDTPFKSSRIPLQTIIIPRTTNIASWHININGTFAATLSYLNNNAHVEIWTLTPSLTIDATIHQTPIASVTFPITLDKDSLPPKLDLTLSHDASRLAVFPSLEHERCNTTTMPDQLQFRVYELDSSFTPVSKQTHLQATLRPCTKFFRDSWLSDFAGVGKFHRLNLSKSQDPANTEEEEYFVASDGYSLTVYNTFGKWTRLLSIPLAVPFDPSQLAPTLTTPEINLAARNHNMWLKKATVVMMASVRGRFFAWFDSYSVMIWDLENCTNISVFLLEPTAMVQDISFSPDGSLVAVATMNDLKVYAVQASALVFSSGGPALFVRSRFVSQGHELLIELHSGEVYLADPLCFDRSRWRPLSIRWLRELQHDVRSVQVQTQVELINNDGTNGGQMTMLQEANFAYVVTGSALSVYGIEQYVTRAAFKGRSIDAGQLYPDDMLSERKDKPFVKFGSSEDGDPCTQACMTGESLLKEKPQTCVTPEGLHFEIQLQPRSRGDNGWDETVYVASLTLTEQNKDGSRTRTEVQRTCHSTRHGRFQEVFFLPCRRRYVIWGEYYFQVWSLPETRTGVYELLIMKSVPGPKGPLSWFQEELFICSHGRVFCPRTLGKPTRRERDMVILQPQNQITPGYSDWCLDSVHSAVLIYNDANQSHRTELLRYLSRYINYLPELDNFEKSVLGQIALKDRVDDSSLLFKDLLQVCASSPLHWIPRIPEDPENNPIAVLLERAKAHARYLVLAATMIEYCIHQAKQRRNVGYLGVVHQVLPKMTELFPDLAMQVIAQSAFVPVADVDKVSKRDYVVNHALISHRPSLRAFWRPNTTPIHETVNPVFQVQPLLPVTRMEEVHDELNERFTATVYVAPFELLWYYDQARQRRFSEATTWWRALLSAALDNPAIIALLEYKWNSFVGSYWLFRFLFQIVYYVLILAVSFLQVYTDPPSDLSVAFVVIIVCSALFLWFEFQQLLESPKRYILSPYNYLDIAVYTMPFIVGILHLIELSKAEVTSDISTRILSFTILIVYLHLLFELRVFASVCYISTIILSVIYRIKFFFIIFAACILAFSHSFVHLLHANTSEPPDAGDYPRNLARAISATYFFMGGLYDPVSSLFTGDNVGFHLMMIFYFFLTVILMLNVLIALINEAFSTSDGGWRGVWLEIRLEYIESAESMSFLVPGFRRTHPAWFPKEVYYTASSKEVQAYEEKNAKGSLVSQFVREGSEARKMSELEVILAEKFEDRGRAMSDSEGVVESLEVAGATPITEKVATPMIGDGSDTPLATGLTEMRQEFQGIILKMQEQAQRQQELSDRRLEELKEEMQRQMEVLTALLQPRQR